MLESFKRAIKFPYENAKKLLPALFISIVQAALFALPFVLLINKIYDPKLIILAFLGLASNLLIFLFTSGFALQSAFESFHNSDITLPRWNNISKYLYSGFKFLLIQTWWGILLPVIPYMLLGIISLPCLLLSLKDNSVAPAFFMILYIFAMVISGLLRLIGALGFIGSAMILTDTLSFKKSLNLKDVYELCSKNLNEIVLLFVLEIAIVIIYGILSIAGIIVCLGVFLLALWGFLSQLTFLILSALVYKKIKNKAAA